MESLFQSLGGPESSLMTFQQRNLSSTMQIGVSFDPDPENPVSLIISSHNCSCDPNTKSPGRSLYFGAS